MRDVEREFRESIELLHEQALSVIENNRTTWFDDISDAYRSALAMFPLVWSEYGQVLSDDIERGGRFLEHGPMDVLYRALYTELVAALRSSNEEIASEAVGRIYGMAIDALEVGAPAVLDRMLGFLSLGYELGIDLNSDISKAAGKRAALLLAEFGQLRLVRALTESVDIESQRVSRPMVVRYFHVIGHLLKSMIDRADSGSFIDLDHAWGEMLEFWTPEHDSPQNYELPHLEQRLGAQHPEVVQARLTADLNAERAKIKAGLVRSRTSFRFMLLAWVLRIVKRSGTSQDLLAIGARLRDRFPNLRFVQEAATISLSHEWHGTRSPMSDWLFAEMRPRGAVHGISPEGPLFRTFVMQAIRHLSGHSSQVLEPTDWIRLWRQELTRVAGDISNDDPEWSVLPLAGDFDEARQRFVQLLDEAAEEQAEAEARELREAEVSEHLLDDFKNEVLKAWNEARMLSDLYAAAGVHAEVVTVDDPPPGRSISNWISKEFFVEPVRLGGMESAASMFGRQLAHDEMQQFLRLFRGLPANSTTRTDLGQALRAVLESPEEPQAAESPEEPQATESAGEREASEPPEGQPVTESPPEPQAPASQELVAAVKIQPSLLLLPYDWALLEMLNLSPHQGIQPPAGVGEETAKYFVGYWMETVPAFWLHELENEALIADLGRFLRWSRFALDEEANELAVRLEAFAADEARALALKQIERGDGEEADLEERINQIRQQIFVEARTSQELKVEVFSAARRFVVAD